MRVHKDLSELRARWASAETATSREKSCSETTTVCNAAIIVLVIPGTTCKAVSKMLQLRTVIFSDYLLIFVQEEFSLLVHYLVIFFPALYSVQDLLSKDRMLQSCCASCIERIGLTIRISKVVFTVAFSKIYYDTSVETSEAGCQVLAQP